MTITLGEAIWASVKPIIKIYLIIATGIALSRLALLSVETTRAISDLVLAVLLPCLAFNKIVGSLEVRDAKTVGIVAISAVLVYATGLGAAFIVRSLLPCPPEWKGGILAGGMFPNISDLPIAYLQTMDTFVFTEEEGARGVACAIIFLATFLLCVFNLGGFRLIEHDFRYADMESQSITPSLDISPSYNKDYHQQQQNARESDRSSLVSVPELEEESQESMYTLDSQMASLAPTHTRSSMAPTAISSLPSVSTFSSMTQSSVQAYGDGSDYNNDDRSSNMSNCPSCMAAASHTSSLLSSSSALRNRADSINTLHSVRSIDQRTTMPIQGLPDMIHEYSNVDQFGKERHASFASGFSMSTLYSDGSGYSIDEKTGKKLPIMDRIRSSRLTRMVTSDATVNKHDIDVSGDTVLPHIIMKIPGSHLLMFFLTNCLRPCSVAVFAGLFIAFMPWLKALFVTSNHTPFVGLAPDKQPVLSFVMDYTGYLGAASVPFGLLLLGATLGRLEISSLYPGFWKTATLLVFLKLCVMPIFGVLWCDRLVKAGWCTWEDDKMLLFVISMTWGLPTMTTLIYFTASYTPPDAEDHVQIDCTSFFIVLQYPLLIISLPFLVTYMLMVQLKV
ncbi:similar to Saccharomyces cerevisiae YOR092W ECM3 Non-essential protein of unknown function [Maudiozyma barnettii]|uniref:Protein ECM3 n=1 Tax=Maudiozyma barnettii TaxID=61262 RepID=A0A8H2VC38_9SACH|nr:uncharacterized protein KABA2_01S15356 [Kazachstania barnettii]CAB4252513.1 similar to Saccharomyces cerevisiae YOR092W ECM3 Non-essential protein of unknown function [Kazachstania barnettii]CAD1779247.1 similar to Saccharomyces cerevisiae YOR092W ECM3 Non-essential protein of unknown function [Kazachstania barnettii]